MRCEPCVLSSTVWKRSNFFLSSYEWSRIPIFVRSGFQEWKFSIEENILRSSISVLPFQPLWELFWVPPSFALNSSLLISKWKSDLFKSKSKPLWRTSIKGCFFGLELRLHSIFKCFIEKYREASDSEVKNLPAVPETQEMMVWSLGLEDSLKKEMTIHSSIFAQKPHGWRSLAGYSS